MMVRFTRPVLALALALGAASLAPLSATAGDRPITPEEMRQIEQTLRREGYTRWGEVEFEHGRFEVDDAVHTDGRRYDLKLSAADFVITEKKLDD